MLRRILVGLALALAASTAVAQDAVDWPQLGRTPQRSNYTPEKVGGTYNMQHNGPNDWTHRWLVKFDSPVAQRTTPVMADGLVAIGTYDGVMHGIDFDSGEERWTYETGGPIEHTAAIVDDKVFFGSADWSVYAVSAKTGKKLWSQKTGRGIVAAPLVVNGKVYIGSKDGLFYCIDADSGEVVWKTDVGEPINVSAAWSEDAQLIFTGTVGMHAVALTPDGEIAWKRKLQGQSLQGAWPQVGERWGVVIYRALGAHTMWDNIDGVGNAMQRLFTEDEKKKVHFVPWNDPPEGKVHHGQYVKEHWTFDEFQDRVQAYLQAHPSYQTFFALDVKTGKDRYEKPVPVLYTWGVSQTMHAQAIDNIDGRAWSIWRGWQMLTEDGSMPDLGQLDLSTGRFMDTPPIRMGGGDVQPGLMGGDEHTPITAAGDTVFHGQNRGPGGWSFVKLHDKGSSKYPQGYYKTFKVMGHRWRSSEMHGKGDEGQSALKPYFIRTDCPVTYTHGNLLFQVGGGVTCWAKPGATKEEK